MWPQWCAFDTFTALYSIWAVVSSSIFLPSALASINEDFSNRGRGREKKWVAIRFSLWRCWRCQSAYWWLLLCTHLFHWFSWRIVSLRNMNSRFQMDPSARPPFSSIYARLRDFIRSRWTDQLTHINVEVAASDTSKLVPMCLKNAHIFCLLRWGEKLLRWVERDFLMHIFADFLEFHPFIWLYSSHFCINFYIHEVCGCPAYRVAWVRQLLC